jgi:hypothetical protein
MLNRIVRHAHKDLVAEFFANKSTVGALLRIDPAYELAAEKSIGHCMIAVSSARRPVRRLCCQ